MIDQLEHGVEWLRSALTASSAALSLPSMSLLLHDMQTLLSDLSHKRQEIMVANRVTIGAEQTTGEVSELLFSARLAGTIVTTTKE